MTKRFSLQTVPVLLSLVVFSTFLYPSANAADSDVSRLVFRLEIQKNEKQHIHVSVPLTIIQMLHDSLPDEVKKIAEDTGPMPVQILRELKTLNGRDLLRVEGKDNVRVWIDEVDDNDDEALQFIFVQIRQSGDKKNRFDLCLPVGIVSLWCQSMKNCLENEDLKKMEFFPPEIKKLLEELKELQQD